MNDRDCCQKFAAFVVVVVVYVHSTTPQQSYQKRGQVKRSAGKSSRKKIQYRIFFFFHLCTSSDGHQCLGPVSFRSVTSSPDTNKKKIRPKSAMNGTQKRNEARDGGLCEREKKENTVAHMQEKSPIAIGYGSYFYRLSKIPSTRVGALARVSCVYQCTCTVCLC